MLLKKPTSEGALIFLFFILLLAGGLYSFKDYGIPWDEPIQRQIGIDTWNYLDKTDTKLLSSVERYHGSNFELLLLIPEKVFGWEDTRSIYLSRHLLTFLTFYVGVFFFYLLCKKSFGNRLLGLAGAAMLTVSPRIFADSFYNSKDIPVMVMFIICCYTLSNLLEKPTIKNAVIHAFATAFAIDIRVIGIIIPCISGLQFFLLWLSSPEKRKDAIKVGGAYLAAAVIFTIAMWPVLWKSPVSGFTKAFNQMSRYPQETTMYFFGQKINSLRIPWYYTPGWILVSTPPMYLFLFVSGLTVVIIQAAKNSKTDLTILLWLAVPLASVVFFKSVLYDSWRQMFFVYPPIVYLAVKGLSWQPKILKIFAALLLAGQIGSTSIFMVKNHPYQYMYLNMFATQRFEGDYWGLSYKQSLEYLLKKDVRPKITVQTSNLPGKNNLMILTSSQKGRLTLSRKPEGQEYFVTSYRTDAPQPPQNYRLIYKKVVNGNPVSGIYKQVKE